MKQCQLKLSLCKHSYLRPPKQRTKSRFLNQGKIIAWAKMIFQKWDELDDEAQ
ncbi:MAG: hypothetical protein ACPGXZ_13370 [Saprospiraceae bacterium]